MAILYGSELSVEAYPPSHSHGSMVQLKFESPSNSSFVSKNSGTPKSSILHNRVFCYKSSILGYPYFWKHPYGKQVRIWVSKSWLNFCDLTFGKWGDSYYPTTSIQRKSSDDDSTLVHDQVRFARWLEVSYRQTPWGGVVGTVEQLGWSLLGENPLFF